MREGWRHPSGNDKAVARFWLEERETFLAIYHLRGVDKKLYRIAR